VVVLVAKHTILCGKHLHEACIQPQCAVSRMYMKYQIVCFACYLALKRWPHDGTSTMWLLIGFVAALFLVSSVVRALPDCSFKSGLFVQYAAELRRTCGTSKGSRHSWVRRAHLGGCELVWCVLWVMQ
jgi:hypothetical protein